MLLFRNFACINYTHAVTTLVTSINTNMYAPIFSSSGEHPDLYPYNLTILRLDQCKPIGKYIQLHVAYPSGMPMRWSEYVAKIHCSVVSSGTFARLPGPGRRCPKTLHIEFAKFPDCSFFEKQQQRSPLGPISQPLRHRDAENWFYFQANKEQCHTMALTMQ